MPGRTNIDQGGDWCPHNRFVFDDGSVAATQALCTEQSTARARGKSPQRTPECSRSSPSPREQGSPRSRSYWASSRTFAPPRMPLSSARDEAILGERLLSSLSARFRQAPGGDFSFSGCGRIRAAIRNSKNPWSRCRFFSLPHRGKDWAEPNGVRSVTRRVEETCGRTAIVAIVRPTASAKGAKPA